MQYIHNRRRRKYRKTFEYLKERQFVAPLGICRIVKKVGCAKANV